MASQPIVVTGDGVFGLSTALHILDTRFVDIVVISNPEREAPSEDGTKIMRIDYTSVRRMEEAICAQIFWRTHPRFKPFFHEVGRYVMHIDLKALEAINVTRDTLNLERREPLGRDELRELFGSTAAIDGLIVTFNEDDGLIALDLCMQSLRDEISSHPRCRVIHKRVGKLGRERDQISNITFTDGEAMDTKEHIIVLAAGAWTGELLTNSGLQLPSELRIPLPTWIFAFMIGLQEEQVQLLKGRRIISHIGCGKWSHSG